ncbi:hypothetical protein [Parasphingorhabdus sp.]|uniref:hypothetical protein n=1 Tax=Parasphingorhabdus sp. TaxID=2709688 RepID=UPI0030034752
MTDATAFDIPDFIPAPCRRHNGWTAERQRAFIGYLARIGLVAPAARAVGMSRQSAYALREKTGAESFAEAWDLALEMGLGNAEDHAIARALDGYELPYFYGGRQCGTIRRYDHRLLLAALARGDRREEKLRGVQNQPLGSSTKKHD